MKPFSQSIACLTPILLTFNSILLFVLSSSLLKSGSFFSLDPASGILRIILTANTVAIKPIKVPIAPIKIKFCQSCYLGPCDDVNSPVLVLELLSSLNFSNSTDSVTSVSMLSDSSVLLIRIFSAFYKA